MPGAADFISERLGVPKDEVYRVLGALKEYELLGAEQQTATDEEKLRSFFLLKKAVTEDELQHFQEGFVEKMVRNGVVVRADSKVYRKKIYALANDGSEDISKFSDLSGLLEGMLANRGNAKTDNAGFVRIHSYLRRGMDKKKSFRETIIDLLRVNGRLSLNAICTSANMKRETARTLLSVMVRKNEIARVSRAVYALPENAKGGTVAKKTSSSGDKILEVLGDGKQHAWEELVKIVPHSTLSYALNSLIARGDMIKVKRGVYALNKGGVKEREQARRSV